VPVREDAESDRGRVHSEGEERSTTIHGSDHDRPGDPDLSDRGAVRSGGGTQTLSTPGSWLARSRGSVDAAGGTFRGGDLVAERFRVVRFLARGGMGEVYEALDTGLEQRVALKVLPPDIASEPDTGRRFRREVRLMREIAHRNVCRVFEVFRHTVVGADGAAREIEGFSMELLEGETLAERLERVHRLPPGQVLEIVRQVAAGLDAAHAAGVVHRDLKTSNVMLVADRGGERAVVTDFGIARHAGPGRGTEDVTATAVAMGTVDYMSPEQARGETATPASDVYALGVVMFEMVTGRRPHVGDTPVALLLERVRVRPPSPRRFVRDLDSRWERVILRCMEVRPEDRYRSAGAAVAALSGASGVGDAAIRLRRLARGPVGAGILAAAALGAVVAAWMLLRGGASPRVRGVPPPVQLTSSTALEVDPRFSPDGRAVAYSTNRSGRFEIAVLRAGRSGTASSVTADGQQNFQPTFSPDGLTLAYASHGRGGIWTIAADGSGSPRRVTTFGSHPEWSPDGRWIAFQSSATAVLSANAVAALPPSTLWLVPSAGGDPRPVTTPGLPVGGHGAPSWSPDGRRLYFTASDRRWSQIWSVSLDGNDLRPVVTAFPAALDPVVVPPGDRLLFAGVSESERYGVWWVALDGRGGAVDEPVVVAGMGMANLRHLAVDPAGDRLVYSALTTVSDLWSVDVDPAEGAPLGVARPLTRSSGRHSRPAWAPDGTAIALDRWQVGRDQDIWVMAPDGSDLRQITSESSMDTLASWAPDAAALVFFSDRGGSCGLWRRALGASESRRLVELGPHVDAVRLSPDGRRVAFHAPDDDGVLNVWVAGADGAGRRQLTFEPELAGFPCWSDDGSWLAVEVRREGDDQVAAVLAQGGAVELLTQQPGKSWPYDVADDRVAFAALRDGAWDIWWVSRATRRQTRLTDLGSLTGYVRYPAWSPAGDRVVFEKAETAGDLWLVEGLGGE